jgi:hypothetical protein
MVYKLHTVVINKSIPYTEACKIFKEITEKNHGFVRETENSYRFRYIPKTKFYATTFRTKKINDNVSLIYGKLLSDLETIKE